MSATTPALSSDAIFAGIRVPNSLIAALQTPVCKVLGYALDTAPCMELCPEPAHMRRFLRT